MNFYEQKQIYDARYNKGLSEAGIFFAFSEEQMQKQMRPGSKKEDYVSYFGIGDIIHKDDVANLKRFLEVDAPLYLEEFLSNVEQDDLIRYELANHECGYTMDISEVVEIVKDYYKIDEKEAYSKVHKVFKNKYMDKADEDIPQINDLSIENNEIINVVEKEYGKGK